MKKHIIITLIFLYFAFTLIAAFPVGQRDMWVYVQEKFGLTGLILLTLGLFSIVPLLISYIGEKYPKEHTEVKRIAYVPHNRYGWYALIAYFGIFFLLYGYAILSR